MEQDQQADRRRRNADVVCRRRTNKQTPVSGNAYQFAEGHAQPDGDHHFKERDRREHMDKLIDGHGRDASWPRDVARPFACIPPIPWESLIAASA